jgi:hypothetical protein
MKILISLLACLTLLSACAIKFDDPRDEDKFASRITERTDDKAVYMKRAFLGLKMLEPGSRRKVIEYWNEQDSPWKLNGPSDSAVASAAGDALSGTVNSGLGAALSLGFALFGSDGSSKFTAGLYLPEEVNGEKLDTIEKASIFSTKLMQDSVQKVYKISGYTGKCIYRCNTFNETHLFTRNTDPVDGDFIYLPQSFAISFISYRLESAETTADTASRALGFPVKYKSPDNYNRFNIIDNFERHNSGKIKDNGVTEMNKMLRPLGSRDIERTKFGRHILRTLFSNPYMYQGSQDRDYLAYNGELFTTFGNSIPSAFNRKILD